MKLDPISIVTNPEQKLDKKFFFISGNETTLIFKVREIIVNFFKFNDGCSVRKIKNISLYKNELGLFENKSVYIVNDILGIDNDVIEKISKDENYFLFISENSPKNRLIKKIFLNRDDSYLIDCYELDRNTKIRILGIYLNKIGIELGKEVYWNLIDLLDNKYVFFEKEIEKIKYLKNKDLNEIELRKLISKNSDNLEKIFFDIMNKNEKIVNSYTNKISNINDVYSFFFLIKQYCTMVINCDDEKEFEKNLPRYLFREKSFLISFYRCFNPNKKKLLIRLISKTEKLLRLNSEYGFYFGLRFVLSLKKIIIS